MSSTNDLQKGERYVDLNYRFLLLGVPLVIHYDPVCQINLSPIKHVDGEAFERAWADLRPPLPSRTSNIASRQNVLENGKHWLLAKLQLLVIHPTTMRLFFPLLCESACDSAYSAAQAPPSTYEPAHDPTPSAPPQETFPHIDTPQSFLEMGIEIQHAQRVLKYKLDANEDPEPYMFVRLDEKKIALKKRIATFCALQCRFMPKLHSELTADQRRDLANEDLFGVPAMCLYLPSSLDVEQRRKVCSDTLIKWETELRDQEVRLAQSQIEFAGIKR
ncbi:hypothetical protein B0H16DRAFT_1743017 [Mycena metata]|uniref:Uncharacterized protein n=1 Tax=Mycena metata TaxID=1033252 RepID=A0AAD7MER5_9AGAR|nr:hypothetical protein B0H16DRAFT_1743017 [Mycena metata]